MTTARRCWHPRRCQRLQLWRCHHLQRPRPTQRAATSTPVAPALPLLPDCLRFPALRPCRRRRCHCGSPGGSRASSAAVPGAAASSDPLTQHHRRRHSAAAPAYRPAHCSISDREPVLSNPGTDDVLSGKQCVMAVVATNGLEASRNRIRSNFCHRAASSRWFPRFTPISVDVGLVLTAQNIGPLLDGFGVVRVADDRTASPWKSCTRGRCPVYPGCIMRAIVSPFHRGVCR